MFTSKDRRLTRVRHAVYFMAASTTILAACADPLASRDDKWEPLYKAAVVGEVLVGDEAQVAIDKAGLTSTAASDNPVAIRVRLELQRTDGSRYLSAKDKRKDKRAADAFVEKTKTIEVTGGFGTTGREPNSEAFVVIPESPSIEITSNVEDYLELGDKTVFGPFPHLLRPTEVNWTVTKTVAHKVGEPNIIAEIGTKCPLPQISTQSLNFLLHRGTVGSAVIEVTPIAPEGLGGQLGTLPRNWSALNRSEAMTYPHSLTCSAEDPDLLELTSVNGWKSYKQTTTLGVQVVPKAAGKTFVSCTYTFQPDDGSVPFSASSDPFSIEVAESMNAGSIAGLSGLWVKPRDVFGFYEQVRIGADGRGRWIDSAFGTNCEGVWWSTPEGCLTLYPFDPKSRGCGATSTWLNPNLFFDGKTLKGWSKDSHEAGRMVVDAQEPRWFRR